DGRYEGRVRPLDDVMCDPIALLLGEKDLAREPAIVGPGLEHLLQEPRGPERVLPRLVEEVEEHPVPRYEAGEWHRRQPTNPRGLRRPFRRPVHPIAPAFAACSPRPWQRRGREGDRGSP